MFETEREEDVLEIARPGTVWLSTGWRGGVRTADAAYSVTVPEGWDPDDLATDVLDRLSVSGSVDATAETVGRGAPVLLTGVDVRHARGARLGSVEAFATAGVSNPAALPMDPEPSSEGVAPEDVAADGSPPPDPGDRPIGTVNVVVGTTAALSEGALANLVAVAAEAKAATLLEAVNAPGTTSDAVVVASDPTGPESTFSGSATAVGTAARACVREAVRASLASRYADAPPPTSFSEARHGVVTDVRADVFVPE